MAKKRITINEVAKLAGVHPSTVSRVLTGGPGVSEETRKRVRQLIAALDYHPSVAARNLVTNTTKTIGVLIPRGSEYVFGNPYYLEILRGIGDIANPQGYHILLETNSTDPYVKLFKDRRVDGLLIVSPSMQDQGIAELLYEGYPFVVIGRVGGNNILGVEVDDYQGAYDATKHLLETGYTRIGYIGGPLTHASGLDRLEGYRAALDAHGIRYNPELVTIEKSFLREDGISGIKKLLSKNIEAVLAFNDLVAIGAIDGARSAGLDVPKDLAVVGFDDIMLSAYVSPPLTTIRQPTYEKGAIATRMLLNMLQGRGVEEKDVRLPGKLIVRKSCGC